MGGKTFSCHVTGLISAAAGLSRGKGGGGTGRPGLGRPEKTVQHRRSAVRRPHCRQLESRNPGIQGYRATAGRKQGCATQSGPSAAVRKQGCAAQSGPRKITA